MEPDKNIEPTPEEMELQAIFREMDKGRAPIEENEESLKIIQETIREYRAEKRRARSHENPRS